MFYGDSHLIFERAKQFRNTITQTEMILWGRLKEHFPTTKFRRQHSISLYIVDLYCHAKKLVIEIDGSIHDLEEINVNDELRQKEPEVPELKAIRFTNKEITHQSDLGIETIEKLLK